MYTKYILYVIIDTSLVNKFSLYVFQNVFWKIIIFFGAIQKKK